MTQLRIKPSLPYFAGKRSNHKVTEDETQRSSTWTLRLLCAKLSFELCFSCKLQVISKVKLLQISIRMSFMRYKLMWWKRIVEIEMVTLRSGSNSAVLTYPGHILQT